MLITIILLSLRNINLQHWSNWSKVRKPLIYPLKNLKL